MFPAGFLFSAGVLLLGFAIQPSILEIVHNAMRDLSVMVFGDYFTGSEAPLSRMERIVLAGMGATLVFLSGAVLA